MKRYPTATPVTKAMEMNHWIQDNVQRVRLNDDNISLTLAAYIARTDSNSQDKIHSIINHTVDKLVSNIYFSISFIL